MSEEWENTYTDSKRERLSAELRGQIVSQAILFSNRAFGNPMRPQYCAQLLHGAWHSIFFAEEETALPAAFAFIVAERADAQMTSLVHGLSQCRCAPMNPTDKIESTWIEVFHSSGTDALAKTATFRQFQLSTAQTHFHSLMNFISIRILRTLEATKPVKLANPHGRRKWPASFDDLVLPSVGPENTVKSLVQWTRYMIIDNPWPIELLGRIGHICRSLIVPAIVQSPTVIPTILRFTQEIHDDVAPHLSPQSSTAEIIEITKRLVWRLGRVTSFLHHIFWNATGSPAMVHQVPVERKTAIAQMCSRVIEMLRLPVVVQHTPEADRLGLIHQFMGDLVVFWFLDPQVSSEGVNLDIVEEVVERGKSLLGPPLKQIRSTLIAWKKSMRCYARACRKSPQTSHAFQRCSSCKIVSYCGKECQRRAWPEHKPLCSTITKIIRDGGGDIHSEAFTRNCEEGRVDAGDAEKIVIAYDLWRLTSGNANL